VLDGPNGWRLEALHAETTKRPGPTQASRIDTVLDRPADADVSVQWVVEGWPDDVERGLAAFRARAAGRSVQFVVVDVTGGDPGRWDDDVEVVSVVAGTGWAEARNAGLRRARGGIVLVVDGSIEPVGDVFGPLESALADHEVGVCGPFGIVTRDLRTFEQAVGAGDCDAIEGYLMAFRRDVLMSVGLFDDAFKWYRTADVEWSFRVKDAGLRTVVVDVPVNRHEHRMWLRASPQERDRLSKRNFNRFLDRWRDRWDLVLSGAPRERR
jgi:hypothetical protein